MVKNRKILQLWEDNRLKNSKIDIYQNFNIIDALHNEALELNVFPLRNPLEGLEVDIRVAEVINSVPKSA